ncbi:hypothetical protein AVEN_197473-1, partial [Araneus ventricosus]
MCLATTTFCLILYFRSPAVKQPRLNNDAKVQKEKDEKVKPDVQIDVEDTRELSTKENLVDGASIAIYKIMNADSDVLGQGKIDSKKDTEESSNENSPD